MTKATLNHQAQIFTWYLVKRPATPAVAKLYVQANLSDQTYDKKDKKLLDFVQRHPKSIGLIDAGLPFYKPQSEVRRRIYFMFAILEASPDYYDCFLSKNRNPIYVVFLIYVGVRSIIKTLVGTVLVRVIA